MKDLCVKAYNLLSLDFDLPAVKIFLEKKSPVGAGLGGGSADAAYMIKALNSLCGLSLDNDAMASYAARLGSDCAFFIYDRPMFASGRGEILEDIELPIEVVSGNMENVADGNDGCPSDGKYLLKVIV
ncbi:4-diphosphocytidyl-2-C-methyl-D-erythritol kinase, partial [gut metagenome]